MKVRNVRNVRVIIGGIAALLLLVICVAVIVVNNPQITSDTRNMGAIRNYVDNDVIGSFNNISNINYLTKKFCINCEYPYYQRQGIELINNSTIHYSVGNGSGKVVMFFNFEVIGDCRSVVHNPVVYFRNDGEKPCDGGEVIDIYAILESENCFGPSYYHRPDELGGLFDSMCSDNISNYTLHGILWGGAYTIYRVSFRFDHNECDINDSFYIGIDDLGGYHGVDGNGNRGADNKEIKIRFVP